MEQEALKSLLESLLFVSNKPLKIKELATFLEQEPDAIKSALDFLRQERKEAGVVVLESNGEYQLATAAKNSTAVKNYLNAELREKLTDATVEVLAIIAYRQPISKAEIEAIRGVNSQYSIRNLLMRGLIEKVANPNDARSFFYQTTTEFLMHMGLASVSDLPEFEKLVGQIKLPETPQATAEAAAEIAQTENSQPAGQAQEASAPEQQPVPGTQQESQNETMPVMESVTESQPTESPSPQAVQETMAQTTTEQPSPDQPVPESEEEEFEDEDESDEEDEDDEDEYNSIL